MKEDSQRWHHEVLSLHESNLYETLLYKWHLVTDTCKEYVFIDKKGKEWLSRGYLAVKEVEGRNIKYFIQESFIDFLPIRIDESREYFIQDSTRVKSIVHVVVNPVQFKINPEKKFEDEHEFIDSLANFKHSEPKQWTLNKIMAVTSLVGKTFLGISSEPEFGKSSIYEILHALTKRSPVFQPRSIPGLYNQITGDGNMVFDEPIGVPSEVRKHMETVSLKIAGGSAVIINGALDMRKMKPRYNVKDQSITFLYNNFNNYSDPDKNFFDNMWEDKDAMKSRFLTVKLSGKLLEVFDKEYDMIQCAEDNKIYFINVAKHILYLTEEKSNNSYQRRWVTNQNVRLNGRKATIFNEITWMIDRYCNSQDEYDIYIALLERDMLDYRAMIGEQVSYPTQIDKGSLNAFLEPPRVSTEPIIEMSITDFLKKHKKVPYEILETVFGENVDKELDKLTKEGEIFESPRGYFNLLE